MQQLIEYAGHHPWLVAFALLAAAAVVAYEMRQRQQDAGALAPQDVVRLMNQGAAVFDLRSTEAFAGGHISGARHLPSEQLSTAADTLKKYKDRPLVVCAETGAPGAAAARKLSQQGFSKAFALRGGLAAWRAENLPLARD